MRLGTSISLSSLSLLSQGRAPFAVTLTGLTNGEAIIGDHATIGYVVTGETFGAESGITATSTFAQDSVITIGTGAGEVDDASDAVFAFTVPSGWSAGASQGGIVVNLGGFTGSLVVLDDAGRLFAGSTSGGQIVSTAGAVSGGARVVVQFALGQAIKVWVNNVAVHGGALEEASLGTVSATSFSGGNDSGYISRTAGTVTNGQQDINTTLADFSLWSTYGNLAVEQAPVGTWGDLTYYKSQTVTTSETVKWSSSANPADAATYGTGANPTDFTAGDEGRLYLHVTAGGETVTRSALIRYARGTAPAVVDGQTWTVDDTAVNIDASASGANLTFTYAATGLPAGLAINSSTGAITGTATEASSGTATVTATDQYGLNYVDTFTFTGSLRTQATAAGALGPFDFPVDSAITNQDLSADFTANGNTLTYTISPTLPTGLSLASNGILSGTPTVITASASYTVTGQDEYGRDTDSVFTLEVSEASGVAPYAANGISPEYVLDFDDEFYATSSASVTQPNAVDYSTTGLHTMVDSTGTLVWQPHNLALNSSTPATQSITVVSGVDYTVECTGSGSVTLSGAGTGTVTEGNPVEVTASTTSLTLTVSGSVDLMWAYRSDLGGMASVPVAQRVAGSETYVPTTSTAKYLPRVGHHKWNGAAWVNKGLRFESDSYTNLLLNTNTLSTQDVTVTAVPHTLYFTGTGSVTLSGTGSGTLNGTGTGENNRVSLTFTPTAGTLTLTVTGTVTNAQLQTGSVPSSYIPTNGSQVTVPAETLTATAAQLPWNASNVSIAMRGEIDYADSDTPAEAQPFRWFADTENSISVRVNTSSANTGLIQVIQEAANVIDVVGVSAQLTPGLNVPFSIASRHGSTFLNAASDGTAETANTTPTSLPDLETTDMQIATAFSGTIEQFIVWADDTGDTGIEETST